MTEDLIRRPPADLARAGDLALVLESWRLALSPASLREYTRDLADFARWHLERDFEPGEAPAFVQGAIEALLRAGKLEAEAQVLRYLASLRDRGLATATVARHRAALRSCVNAFADLGLVPWTLTAKQPRSARPTGYRDTRGPGLAAVRCLRAAAAESADALQAARDVALVEILYTLELRRKEAVGLDVEDYREARVWVLPKGKTEKVPMTVPVSTRLALDRYLALRGQPATGPLFASCDSSGKGARGGRLSKGGLWQVLQRLAAAGGVPLERVSPHRIRHSSITDALDASGGDVRRVQKLSRHARVETVLIYDDARQDVAGELAEERGRALSGELESRPPCPHCGCTCGGKGLR